MMIKNKNKKEMEGGGTVFDTIHLVETPRCFNGSICSKLLPPFINSEITVSEKKNRKNNNTNNYNNIYNTHNGYKI